MKKMMNLEACMKITFLGSSHGVPAADRYCSCTMLEIGNSLYFIDAGCPLLDVLLRRGEDLKRVRAVFTTHLHGDHVYGLFSFIDLCNWYFKDVHAGIYLTEQAGIDDFCHLIMTTQGIPLDHERLHFHLVQAGLVYADENIRITAIPTRHLAHSNRPSFAYLVEAEGKRILFTGDLSNHLAENDFPTLPLEENVDLMISEMAHFNVDEFSPYLARCKTKQVIFNHVFPLEKIPQIAALDGKYGYPIHPVEDNETFEL